MRTRKLLRAAEDAQKGANTADAGQEGTKKKKKKVPAGRVVELADGVTVEDIEDEEDEEEQDDYDPNEMTENTPEVRVKVRSNKED